MKYVLNEDTLEFVLIPQSMNHSSVFGEWTHAGFVNIYQEPGKENMTVSCYGKSTSLGLSYGERDAVIIRNSISEGF